MRPGVNALMKPGLEALMGLIVEAWSLYRMRPNGRRW